MANEQRLIDANVLMEHLARCIEEGKGLLRAILVAVKCFVVQMPTVDAVEVVRCEKCLYRSQYCDENGFYKCGGIQNEDGECFLMVEPTHFCAFGKWRGKLGAKMDGERRTDGKG